GEDSRPLWLVAPIAFGFLRLFFIEQVRLLEPHDQSRKRLQQVYRLPVLGYHGVNEIQTRVIPDKDEPLLGVTVTHHRLLQWRRTIKMLLDRLAYQVYNRQYNV